MSTFVTGRSRDLDRFRTITALLPNASPNRSCTGFTGLGVFLRAHTSLPLIFVRYGIPGGMMRSSSEELESLSLASRLDLNLRSNFSRALQTISIRTPDRDLHRKHCATTSFAGPIGDAVYAMEFPAIVTKQERKDCVERPGRCW